MTVTKNFPVRHVIFTGDRRGKVVAVTWVEFGSDWIERAEEIGERMAAEWGAEIDIETGSVWPSGKVAAWDRAGIRVQAPA